MADQYEIKWVHKLYAQEYRASFRGADIAVIHWTDEQQAAGQCMLWNNLARRNVAFEGIATDERGLIHDEISRAMDYVFYRLNDFLSYDETPRAARITRKKAIQKAKPFDLSQFNGYQPDPAPLAHLDVMHAQATPQDAFLNAISEVSGGF